MLDLEDSAKLCQNLSAVCNEIWLEGREMVSEMILINLELVIIFDCFYVFYIILISFVSMVQSYHICIR